MYDIELIINGRGSKERVAYELKQLAELLLKDGHLPAIEADGKFVNEDEALTAVVVEIDTW